MKPAIIVPVFSKAKSLQRLLDSLNRAHYPDDGVTLIISADGGATEEVLQIADLFRFVHGKKEVIKRENNMGLREHIMWCGDQSQKYGSVIILEDDLYVDEHYYSYSTAAIHYYSDQKDIAGISLYAQRYNPMAKLAFDPMFNGYSTYFMQLPSSWGQAWTAGQWSLFRQWYEGADTDSVYRNPRIPRTVKNWPETSWKKYFFAFMVENNLWFVYPYQSYTTNCADEVGVHMLEQTSLHHVPLGAFGRPADAFKFCEQENSEVRYDSFLEPDSAELYELLGVESSEIEIDIYGVKPVSLLKESRFTLTSKKCKNPISTYRMAFRPVEKIPISSLTDYKFQRGFSNHLFFSESSNIVSKKRPFFEQVNYLSYYQLNHRYFRRRYILHYITKLINKLRIWK